MSHPSRSLALLLAALLLAACGVSDRGPLSAPAPSAPAEDVTPALSLPVRETVVATGYPPPAAPPVAPLTYPPPVAALRDPLLAYPAPPTGPTPTYAPPTIDLGVPLARRTGEVQISSDSRYAVFFADEDGDQRFDLISARLDKSSASILYTSIQQPPTGASGRLLTITPDSSAVVFQIPGDGLYRAPIDGGQPTRIGPPSDEVRLSPDGAWVIAYRSNSGLFSIPISGGEPVQLGGPLPISALYEITADSRYVVFGQGQLASAIELYSAPIGGGERRCLSCIPGAPQQVMKLQLTADGRAAVYTYRGVNEGYLSLAAAPVAGGPPVTLWDGAQNGSVDWWFWLSPDSAAAVFTVHGPSGQRVYAAPVGGGPAVALGETLRAEPPVGIIDVGPGYALLMALQANDASIELYRAPLDGGQPLRLTGPRPFAGQIYSARLALSSERVVFTADIERQGVMRLYSLPIGGGAPVALSEPLPAGIPQIFTQLTPDGMAVVYPIGAYAFADIIRYDGLFIARINGQGGRLLADGGGLGGIIFAPDSQRALIIADRDGDGASDVYVVELWQ